ncbi:MAG TPA: hypothetical protein VMH28_00890 [Candidatus Acidoferrales bacterium]|nr:hypothetical protein [Candidatus Acidoferrales bacterium]
MTETGISNPIVVAVVSPGEDERALREILDNSAWRLHIATTFAGACLKLRTCCVVISESSYPDGLGWRDLLLVIQGMISPPPLIVTDRLADERLWAEVLNLGAFDLLAKPFHPREVLHAITVACSRRQHQERLIAARSELQPTGRKVAPALKARAAGASR